MWNLKGQILKSNDFEKEKIMAKGKGDLVMLLFGMLKQNTICWWLISNKHLFLIVLKAKVQDQDSSLVQ